MIASSAVIGPVPEDDYVIYELLIADYFGTGSAAVTNKLVLIESLTCDAFIRGESWTEMTRAHGLDCWGLNGTAEALQDYIAVSMIRASVNQRMNLPFPYQVLDSALLEKPFEGEGDGWKRFYEAFPDARGISTLSRVGYDRERITAIANISHVKGYTYGAGSIYSFQSKEGLWTICDRQGTWRS